MSSTQYEADIGVAEDETVSRGREIVTVALNDVTVGDLPDRVTQGRVLPVTGRSRDFHRVGVDGWEGLINKLSGMIMSVFIFAITVSGLLMSFVFFCTCTCIFTFQICTRAIYIYIS